MSEAHTPLTAPAAAKKKAKPARKVNMAVDDKAAMGAVDKKTHLQKCIAKLGLHRDIDLALHLPLRYEDETRLTKLRDAREGDTVQIEGVVTKCEITNRPRRQLLVTLDDGSDTCTLRFFSFYPSQQKALAVGNVIRARGEVKGGFLGFTMMHPSFKTAGGDLAIALTPVYPTVAGLPQGYLRKVVLGGLARADLSETMPADLFQRHFSAQIDTHPAYLLPEALSFLHQPTPDVSLAQLEDRTHPAWQRLKVEELLAQQLSQLQAKRERAALRAPVLQDKAINPLEPSFPRRRESTSATMDSRLRGNDEIGANEQSLINSLYDKLLAIIPFKLTAAQERVCSEITFDLARNIPMHRLLQGDVGSGKTVVAALAAAKCMDAGWQCALMAPTEILAEQHFRKLLSWLEPLGITTAWLTGSQKTKERRESLALIASGEAALVVGTHAVIQDKVQFKNLALAIIDEQHRFGVAQRLALRGKASVTNDGSKMVADTNLEPHLLMMTATPIPRTLAMSYYADLDVSTIDELPPGRTPIVTKVVNDARRDEVIERIRSQLIEGRQIYWVCPLIEESEALDLTNATETHEQLCAALGDVQLKDGQPIMVGLLHSRMPVAEKKAVMSLFTSGHMQVLVSTTVIEVGVDVPNASLMVIEHAERFGLSQLHQLRGRVGRGAAASVCVLLYSTGDSPRLGETARARLKAMAETNDGFEIARRDLEIRGPGEFLGARQSGAALLRFADLATDTELLEGARRLAPVMLDKFPELAQKHVKRWLGGKAEYLKA